MNLEALKVRVRELQARREGLVKQLEEAKKNKQGLYQLSVALYEIDGRIKECEAWKEWLVKYPPIERPEQLPTTENTPAQATLNDEVSDFETAKETRMESYRENAIDLAEMLPDADGQ